MAKKDTVVTIDVEVKLTLWSAIKLRISGLPQEVIDSNIQKYNKK